MRTILIIFFIAVSQMLSAQQLTEIFGGRFTTTSSTHLGGTSIQVSGVFKHSRNTWKADSIQVGDLLIDCECNTFVVSAITSVLDNSISMMVTSQDASVTKVKSCTGGIIRTVDIFDDEDYIRFPNDLPTPIIDCILNYNYNINAPPFEDIYTSNDTLYFINQAGDTLFVINDSGINNLSDVDTTGLSTGDILQWNGTTWVVVNAPVYTSSDTSAVTLVYAPSHGLTDTISLYGYVPVKADFTRANSTSVDSAFIAYAIDAPHPDSLLLMFSGYLTYLTWHGKELNTQYYLQDDGSEDTSPGTVSIPTAIASDSLTLLLREVGTDIVGSMRRIAMPSPLITAFGGNPASPTDTVVQLAISTLYLPAGLAQPGTIFTLSYPTQSYNPTYQQIFPNTNPLTPSYAWLWDGALATRIVNIPTSVNLQDTNYGVLGTLVLLPIDSLMAASVPTDTEVALWLDTNYTANNLRLANGSLLYFIGDSTRQNPQYIWQVIDDISYDAGDTDWEKILKRIKFPAITTLDLAANGLTISGDTTILGGTLDRNTTILGDLKDFSLINGGIINFDSKSQATIGVNTDYNANKHSISDWYVGSDNATWYQELQSASYAQNIYDYAQVDSSSDAASWNLYVKANSKWIADEIGVSNSSQYRRFYGNTGSGNWQYYWPTSSPSSVLSTKSLMTWTGTGSTATPAFETAADVVAAGGGAYGSGLAGRIAYWLDDSTLVHTDITYSSAELNASALTGSFQWPTGTTAEQPVGANGKTRFNSTTGLFEGYHNAAYRPFATFDGTMTSGRIPYWNGTNLVSSSSFTYSTPGLRVSNNSASTEALGVTASNTVNGIAARFIADDVGIDGIGTNGVGGAFSGSQANIYLGLTSSLGGNAKNAIWFGNRPTPYQTDYTHHSFNGIDSRVGLYWEFRQGGHPSICARGLTNLTYDAGTLRMRVYESLCDTIVTGYEFRARRGLSTPVQFEIKNGELHGAFYGDNTITGTPSTWAAWDSNGKFIETTAADIVAAAGGGSSIYNLLPTQDILIDPNANDLVIGSFGAGNSGDFEFFTTNENGQYVGIFAGTRDSSWLATAGDGFQFDAALFSTGAEDGVMGVNYEYFGTVWNAAVFGDSMLFAPYPGSELNMTINGLPDDPVNPYKVMVQDTVTDRVYLTSIDSLLGSGTAGTLPIWNADGTLGNSSLTESGGNVIGTSFTGAFGLATGTTAQAPVGANGRIRYNTTENGISAWNGSAAAWQYLPWADADNWTSGTIPYSDGSKLTSSSELLYIGNELRINSSDQGFYKLQINGGLNINGSSNSLIDVYSTNSYAIRIDNNHSGGHSLSVIGEGPSLINSIRSSSSGRIPLFCGSSFYTSSSNVEMIRLAANSSTTGIETNHAQSTTGSGMYINWVFRQGSTSCPRGTSSLEYTAARINPIVYESDCDTIYVDIDTYARHGLSSPVVHRIRKGQLIMPFYGSGNFTGTPEKSISVTSSGAFVEVPEKWASISTSTDGSGDIVVAHGMGVTPTSVQVTVTGTTPYVVTVHTIGSTNFTVRFYDMTGAAVTSTAVTATWHAKT